MKASKKLIGAIAALAVAASLTVGTTFAWFSSQSSVNTDEIQLGVTSGSDTLQIAVLAKDGDIADANFKYVVSAEEIEAAIGTVEYTALTSDDDGATLAQKGGAAATAGYAEFKFVFRTTMENASLILAETSSVSASASENSLLWQEWEDTYQSNDYGTEITNGEIKTKAAYASRIAFIEGANSKVWAPYEELGEGADTTNTKDAPAGYYKRNLASDYNLSKGVAGATAITAETINSRVYRAKDASTNDALNVIAAFPAADASGFAQLTLTVKIWLEGTDGDCLDAILSDTFGVAFGFRAAKMSQ